jgi:hypothetical protein
VLFPVMMEREATALMYSFLARPRPEAVQANRLETRVERAVAVLELR